MLDKKIVQVDTIRLFIVIKLNISKIVDTFLWCYEKYNCNDNLLKNNYLFEYVNDSLCH